MIRRLSQWVLATGIVCISSLLAMMLFERAAVFVAGNLLDPWFAVCEAVTPLSWQTKGNILLGMMCIISGVVVYSMLIGAACVIALAIMDTLRKDQTGS